MAAPGVNDSAYDPEEEEWAIAMQWGNLFSHIKHAIVNDVYEGEGNIAFTDVVMLKDFHGIPAGSKFHHALLDGLRGTISFDNYNRGCKTSGPFVIA